MKIFTRVLLSILSVGLVFGSHARSFGVVPVAVRSVDAHKSDTALVSWRVPASLTVSDFGISTALTLPSYNPNAKKYSPFLDINKNAKALAANPGLRSLSSTYRSRLSGNESAAKEVNKIIPSLSAYPNPSRGLTNITLSHIGDDNYKVRISNTIGKVIWTYEVKQDSPLPIPVNLSQLPAGVYFYSLLVNEKMVETKRLILQ